MSELRQYTFSVKRMPAHWMDHRLWPQCRNLTSSTHARGAVTLTTRVGADLVREMLQELGVEYVEQSCSVLGVPL